MPVEHMVCSLPREKGRDLHEPTWKKYANLLNQLHTDHETRQGFFYFSQFFKFTMMNTYNFQE